MKQLVDLWFSEMIYTQEGAQQTQGKQKHHLSFDSCNASYEFNSILNSLKYSKNLSQSQCTKAFSEYPWCDSKLMRQESVHQLVYFSNFSLISVQKFNFATAPVRVNWYMYNIECLCGYNRAEQFIFRLHTLNYL